MKSIKETVNFPEPIIIPINDVELEVFEAGKENIGNPIVLCHGFPEHAFSWCYQIPALVEAGYHVIIPNQREYGNSSCPKEVQAYDIINLTDDLVALLEYYNYEKPIFIGHDFYFVHFNKQPGIADAVLEEQTLNFLTNLFRKNVPNLPPGPGMHSMNLAIAEKALGDTIMSQKELKVYVNSFESSGFTGAINWYRNLDRNLHVMANVNPKIDHPTLMIYGEKDVIPKSTTLKDFAPNLSVVSLDCGHHIQQEKPEETNEAILTWLANQRNNKV